MTENTAYQRLAARLDALPNGFPPAPDGAELRLLARLFSPEEADLAANLRLTLETPAQIIERIGGELQPVRTMLKNMTRRGLIKAGRCEGGLGYGLIPFVVGFYENQNGRLDEELARLIEEYFRSSFSQTLRIEPSYHRVIPVGEAIRNDMEILPFESAEDILAKAKAWGVVDCICRQQKALIGEGCQHPLDVCMVFSDKPGEFDGLSDVRALTLEQAKATLRRASEAGLVHSLSNKQDGHDYICNCCTCSCGILRGIAEAGIANAVARSAFVNQVDESLCHTCGMCLSKCQFDALSIETTMVVNEIRCVGCGVCVLACPEGAMSLVRRPEEQVKAPPPTGEAWRRERAAARNIDLNEVL
ncbi:MAG TPA: 4Fe-4S binding protein [Anaerolineales bacterium]|nr:4Fe-4S binding protein [Anaerolineales bacterium]